MAQENRDPPSIDTGGGAFVAGNVEVAAGDFVGRDKVVGYSANQVAALIAEIGKTFQPRPFDGRCPYVGLDSFSEQNADLFFGRERLIGELLEKVKAAGGSPARFIAIAGPSGSGKSSLVRAGLLHALAHGALPGSEEWLLGRVTPQRDPIEQLALTVSRLAKSPEAGDYLRRNSLGAADGMALHKSIESLLSDHPNQRAVIFADQFEETFIQVGTESERSAFIDLLAQAATVAQGRVIVLLALRSDFVGRCATYPQLNSLLNLAFFQVGAMQPDELVSAIASPAMRVGLRIDPDLVRQVVDDMGGEPGALPLMEFALKDLFEAQQAKGGVIALTREDYMARGGIRKSLERHADETLAQLKPGDEPLARSVFSKLVEVGHGSLDTRRTASYDEIAPAGADPARIEAVLEVLSDARLITTDVDPARKVRTITLSHEKLIEAWPWLQKLVNDNRALIALANQISADAATWDAGKRDPSYLYTGARLETVREQLAAQKLALSGPAQTFVDIAIKARGAQQQQRRRSLQILIAGLVAVTLVFAALSGIAVSQAQRAIAQQRVSHSRELAALAISQSGVYPEQALLIALEANSGSGVTQTFESQDALRQALLVARQRSVLSGHTDAVNTASFSRDGTHIVTASDDGTARIWDALTGATQMILRGHTDAVTSASFSPDGKQVVTSSKDGTARTWDAIGGAALRVLRGHAGSVNRAAFSPDGTRIVTAGADGTVRVWDAPAGSPLRTYHGHTNAVCDAQFSSDGGWIVSAGADNTARIWNVAAGDNAQPIVLSGHTDRVNGASFAPAAARLLIVTASRDKTARVWDAGTGRQLMVLRGHTDSVMSAHFSPDGKQIVTSGRDQTARIWDAQLGDLVSTLVGHPNFVVDAQFSPDGRTIVTASNDRTAGLWDAGLGPAEDDLRGHSSAVLSAHFSPDGERAVTASADKTARLWDVRSGTQIRVLGTHANTVSAAQFSLDGKRIVTASGDGTARVWNAETGVQLAVLTGHTGWVYGAQFSPDGTRIATAGNDQTVRLWDASSGAQIAVLRGHAGPVTAVQFSPPGTRLRVATASKDGSARIWDASSGDPLAVLSGHGGWVTSVRFSPDGTRLVTAGDDATARVFEAASGKEIAVLRGHGSALFAAEFSPDGRQIVTAGNDQTARLWDAGTGAQLQVLSGHLRTVYGARFSADGRRIVTASGDQTARIWDSQSGELLAILRGHTDVVYGAEFSPDGRRVLTASVDGTARLHLVDLNALIDQAMSRITRVPPQLRCDERQQVLRENVVCPAPTAAPTPKP